MLRLGWLLGAGLAAADGAAARWLEERRVVNACQLLLLMVEVYPSVGST